MAFCWVSSDSICCGAICLEGVCLKGVERASGEWGGWGVGGGGGWGGVYLVKVCYSSMQQGLSS